MIEFNSSDPFPSIPSSVFFFEFWEDDGENQIKRTKGADGADVSYPGADGGEVRGSSRRERYSVPGTAP